MKHKTYLALSRKKEINIVSQYTFALVTWEGVRGDAVQFWGKNMKCHNCPATLFYSSSRTNQSTIYYWNFLASSKKKRNFQFSLKLLPGKYYLGELEGTEKSNGERIKRNSDDQVLWGMFTEFWFVFL